MLVVLSRETAMKESPSSVSITDKWGCSMSPSMLSLDSLSESEQDYPMIDMFQHKSLTSADSTSSTDLGYCSTPTSDSSRPDVGQLKSFGDATDHELARARPLLVTAI